MTDLIERDEHLRRLDRLLTDAADGRGRVAVLEGPAGTGRTELLRALTDAAARSGFEVLSAACSADERDLPYGVVEQLTGPGTRPAAASGPERLREYRALAARLLEAARDRPLLIGVDDLRHADEESLHFLLHLARRLRSSRVLLALTDSAAAGAAHRLLLSDLCRQPHARRLTLGPLSPEGTARLAGRGDAYAASGGNPLLVDALREDRHVPGAAYGLALVGILRGGGPGHLATARALAVLDEDADPRTLARLTGGEPATAGHLLDALTAAGLLRDGRLRHPVARTAVLDDVPADERAGLHRRAAELLYDEGAPAVRVARHLVAAEHVGAPWAVTVLSDAAEHALLDDRPALAAECLRLARRQGGDDRFRAGLRARLARAEWQVNPAAAARHLAPLVTAAGAGWLGHDDLLILVKHLLWHGRDGEAARVLAGLRERFDRAGPRGADAEGLADLETWLAFRHPPLARDRRAPAPPPARGPVRTGADPQLRCAAILAGALGGSDSAAAADLAERVLRDLRLHQRNPWTEEAVLLALQVLILAERLDAVARWCARSAEAAGGGAVPTVSAVFAAARAEVCLRLGDPRGAAEHARAALEHLPAQAWGVHVGLPLGTLVLAATRLGDHRAAAEALARTVPEPMSESFAGVYHRYARGHHHLATGRPHAALGDFLHCGEVLRAWGLDAAALIPWRTDAAEAWLRLGERDQARHLVHEQLGRPGAHASRARGPALRLLAGLGPRGRRLVLLGEALELAEASGDRFEQARVLAGLGRAYLERGNRRRGRLLVRQALHIAEVSGMAALARELLSISAGPDAADERAAGTRAVPLDELTESERRVASLAVLGYTNREIAARLFVTPSTVEQHLTRVYRKLNVRHRRELPVTLRAELHRVG
ncbi:helix-turn-helix transcriptional regulator [Actinomadura flavalba]|uniref:helix-turn-helix transcriptional regulator n=1 Tax=Actinomadura flavalba TaxID=1120938 RepID=UPI00196A075E|nr:LuxR family transcriptional regulator [Actinomadura flavalba]